MTVFLPFQCDLENFSDVITFRCTLASLNKYLEAYEVGALVGDLEVATPSLLQYTLKNIHSGAIHLSTLERSIQVCIKVFVNSG